MPNTLAVQFEGDAEYTTTFAEWASDNAESPEVVDPVRALQVGQSVHVGGGAGVLVTVRALS